MGQSLASASQSGWGTAGMTTPPLSVDVEGDGGDVPLLLHPSPAKATIASSFATCHARSDPRLGTGLFTMDSLLMHEAGRS
jgi:hypothetical protein